MVALTDLGKLQLKRQHITPCSSEYSASRTRLPRPRKDLQLDYQRCFFVNIRLQLWHAVLSSVSLRYGSQLLGRVVLQLVVTNAIFSNRTHFSVKINCTEHDFNTRLHCKSFLRSSVDVFFILTKTAGIYQVVLICAVKISW